MNFQSAYAMLNPDQKKAVDQIDGPLLVIAGPGTGKTQLLSTRTANILQKTDTNPENILCLTFTEAGASEMRSRLNSLIGPASSKINISTYHAFGSDIIYLYNNFATCARRLDTPLDPVRQYKIISDIRDSLKHNDILKNGKISDIISSIAEIKTARLSAADLSKIANENLLDSQKINAATSQILGEIPKGAKFDTVLPFYEQVREALAPLVSQQNITGKVERIANSLLDSLNDTISEQQSAEKPSTSALTKWRSKFYEKDDQDQFALKNLIANKKLLSLANVLNVYDQILAKDGLFDFADMIEEAISYLKTNDAFRYSVQEKYQYILLDEFQDTNDSQLELIRLIADYEKPNIMAVGDDDQAIFAFQGARYSNLLDFQKLFGAQVVVLTTNYRSSQDIIDLGASTAGQISERFSTKYNIVKKLTSFLHLIKKPQSAPVNALIERREFVAAPSEYSFIAGQISELIKSGTDPQSIAVISPKHKHLEALVPYFNAHPEVKLAYEKRENILTSPEIQPLIKIATLAYNLAKVQPSAPDLLEILSFPFWGIKPSDAIRLVSEAREKHLSALDYLNSSEDSRFQELSTFFAELAVRSLDTPLEIVLDWILGNAPLNDYRSPYLEYFTQENNYSAIHFYENLSVLRERVLEYTPKEQLRLADLVSFVNDFNLAEQKIINTSPYQDADAAVRLLSAHSSKGLEFDHVFLISLDNNSWGTGKGNNNTLVLPKNLEFVRHTGATEDEKLRLFFVAITRAKRHLYLSSSLKDFTGKQLQPLKFLQESNGNSPLLPVISQQIIKIDESAPNLSALQNNWVGRYDIRNPEIQTIATKKLENYRLSASDLTSYVGIIYAGPQELYKRRIIGDISAYSASASYGNFIHDTLDRVTKEKLDNKSALELFKESVLAADLDPEDREDQLEKGLDNLAIYLESRGDFLRQDQHFSEVSFGKERLSFTIDGVTVPISGKIDHIAINQADKTITITDFKTGKYHNESWDSHPSLYLYKLQLQFYKLLLESSVEYRNYQINSAVIDFVTPDDEGKVHQKELIFDEKSLQDMKRLATSVYQNIKQVNFPDTNDREKTLRSIKEFVAELLDQNISETSSKN